MKNWSPWSSWSCWARPKKLLSRNRSHWADWYWVSRWRQPCGLEVSEASSCRGANPHHFPIRRPQRNPACLCWEPNMGGGEWGAAFMGKLWSQNPPSMPWPWSPAVLIACASRRQFHLPATPPPSISWEKVCAAPATLQNREPGRVRRKEIYQSVPLFIFWIVSSAGQNLLIFTKFSLSFFLRFMYFVSYQRNIC